MRDRMEMDGDKASKHKETDEHMMINDGRQDTMECLPFPNLPVPCLRGLMLASHQDFNNTQAMELK